MVIPKKKQDHNESDNIVSKTEFGRHTFHKEFYNITNLFHLCTIDCLLGLCYLYGERRPIPLPLAAIWRYDIYIGRDAHSCAIACPLAECYLYGEWCPILVPLSVLWRYVTWTGSGAPSLYHWLSSGGMLPVRGVVPHVCTTGYPLVVCYLYGEWCPIPVPMAVRKKYVTCTGSGAPSLYHWLSAGGLASTWQTSSRLTPTLRLLVNCFHNRISGPSAFN